MYSLLIRLMLLSALLELGISAYDLSRCRSRQCLKEVEKASRNILKIDWKPISLFPGEAKRFK